MSALKVGGKVFRTRYTERTKSLLKLAGDLPDRPSPGQVHDLRVTIRRTQVMGKLLPRRVRMSQGFGGFTLALKSVMKATSQARDLDTLMDTLERYRSRLPADLLVALSNQRSDAAARARSSSDLLADAAPGILPLGVRGKKLSRRLRSLVKKRGRVVLGLLKQVPKDETKTEELHSLRKEAKVLRYFLELADGSPRELPILTRWQDSLGAIHDLDVAIAYLGENQVAFERDSVLRELKWERHRCYLKFVHEYRSDSMTDLGDSALLPGETVAPPL